MKKTPTIFELDREMAAATYDDHYLTWQMPPWSPSSLPVDPNVRITVLDSFDPSEAKVTPNADAALKGRGGARP